MARAPIRNDIDINVFLAYSLFTPRPLSVAVYGVGGNRIAGSTGVDLLLREDFDLVVNGYKYRVEVPQDRESHLTHTHTHTPAHTHTKLNCAF